jgi:predicted AAA+ superfamily ATPase
MWCGKTWSSLNHANSVNYIMDPAGGYSNRERARVNPALALEGAKPHLIDEWQEVPGIWDAVRFDVDMNGGTGRYILTGSVSPPRDEYSHSGVGRFGIVRMRPMSLFESGDSSGVVSFHDLFSGASIEPFSADMDLKHLIDITVRGGWPETLNISMQNAMRVSAEYLNLVSKNEVFRSSDRRRSTSKLSKLLQALARSNATCVKHSTLTHDTEVPEGQAKMDISFSRQTITEYMDDLRRTYVIEDLPGWMPEIRSKTRIRMTPKMVFADPSLAIAALGLDTDRLLHDLNTFGFMFENLCLRDISVYAESMDGKTYHYRDNSGLEADAIVELPSGEWGAFEIKLGEHQVEKAAKSLHRLRNKMISAGSIPPACLCIITGGGFGRKRDDGIYVIPINALGA